MINATIAFIGGGNMARSLIGGLLAGGVRAEQVIVADPDESRTQSLHRQFGIQTTLHNAEALVSADVLLLAVKPQVMHRAVVELAEPLLARRPLIVSIAAGIRERDISAWLSADLPIVRTMPNTPALVQSGATALYANDAVNPSQRELAESILRAVGLTVWVDREELMDTVTALSGSGPAYFFLLMEAMEAAARKQGLTRETARLLTLQTAFGAAKLALESEEDAAELRTRVTSPGGTTEKAIKTFEAGGLRELVEKAIENARHRSAELASLFGESK
jgi:pyrroline-5-carboxylate reductase